MVKVTVIGHMTRSYGHGHASTGLYVSVCRTCWPTIYVESSRRYVTKISDPVEQEITTASGKN